MRTYIVVMLLVVEFFLVLCYIRTIKHENQLVEKIHSLMGMSILTVVANILMVIAPDRVFALVVHEICYCLFGWLCWYFLLVCILYTKSSLKKLTHPRITGWILGLDTVFMAFNVFFENEFSVYRTMSRYGEVYYRAHLKWPFYLHTVWCYILILSSLLLLVRRFMKEPVLYKVKYGTIVLVLLFVIVCDVGFVVFETVMDYSIVMLVCAGWIMYFYALVYQPKNFFEGILSQVVFSLEDAIFMFDEDGECIYVNEMAEQMFQVTVSEKDKIARLISGWNHQENVQSQKEYIKHITEIVDDEPVYLFLSMKKVYDNKRRQLGSYIMVREETKQVLKYKKERYLATHDRLTGLYNEAYFAERCRGELESHPKETYMMVCSDVRQFKLVNDIFGQKIGDELLIKIGTVIQSHMILGQVYARLGNDKFAILIRKADYSDKLFEELPKDLIYIERDISYPIHINVGVYEIVDRKMSIAAMCDRALMAIASIKNDYHKWVAHYDESMIDSMIREQEITSLALKAMRNKEFHIYLQPQVTGEGRVLGAEALVRWIDPNRGMISPAEFIEVFEKNGMIVRLDQIVWRLACQQLKHWKEIGREDLYISVNISTKDFYFIDVYEQFSSLVQEFDISPQNLRIEITESAVIMDLERQVRLIQKLQQAGFLVEMDDFGSGYSSLNMLKDIMVDILKIDLGFLGQTAHMTRAKKILEMIVALSKELRMPVVVEGVETEEQVTYLKQIGCDVFQGYYFAKPMPIEDYEELVGI